MDGKTAQNEAYPVGVFRSADLVAWRNHGRRMGPVPHPKSYRTAHFGLVVPPPPDKVIGHLAERLVRHFVGPSLGTRLSTGDGADIVRLAIVIPRDDLDDIGRVRGGEREEVGPSRWVE